MLSMQVFSQYSDAGYQPIACEPLRSKRFPESHYQRYPMYRAPKYWKHAGTAASAVASAPSRLLCTVLVRPERALTTPRRTPAAIFCVSHLYRGAMHAFVICARSACNNLPALHLYTPKSSSQCTCVRRNVATSMLQHMMGK